MGFDEAPERPYLKWIFISIALVIIISIYLAISGNHSSLSGMLTNTPKTFTLTKESPSEVVNDSTNSTYTPQKIGSVEVESGSTTHIDIKGS